MSLAVEWIDGVDRFVELAGEWDALASGDSRPFDLHCWHLAWLEAFAGERELAVCTVRRDGTLAGALPLLREGRRLVALANAHSCDFRPLATGEEEMRTLISAVFESAGAVTLNELPDGDPGVELLTAGARDAGMASVLEPGNVSPIVDTAGDLDAWVTQSNSSWKKRLRRYRRKMYKDHEAKIDVLETPANLEAELGIGFALEASGWKGEAGTAIVSQPQTEAFYRAVAAAFAARDELRLSRVELDGRPVAFSLCIEHGGRLYSLKSGFDESFRKLVPGLVLQVSIVEACFERGYDAYELLGNQTEWKAKLATAQRTHSTLRAYRRNPLGIARHAYRAGLRPRLRGAYRRLSRVS